MEIWFFAAFEVGYIKPPFFLAVQFVLTPIILPKERLRINNESEGIYVVILNHEL